MRNIEAGIFVVDTNLARSLVRQFEAPDHERIAAPTGRPAVSVENVEACDFGSAQRG